MSGRNRINYVDGMRFPTAKKVAQFIFGDHYFDMINNNGFELRLKDSIRDENGDIMPIDEDLVRDFKSWFNISCVIIDTKIL